MDHSYRYVNVTAVYNQGKADGKTLHSDTKTLSASDTGETDLGTDHTYRYVDATNVYNQGKADGKTVHSDTMTLSASDTGETDLGTDHTYRYVDATDVYNQGKEDGKTTHSSTLTLTTSQTGKTDMGTDHSYRYVDATNVYNKGKTDGAAGRIRKATIYNWSQGGCYDVGRDTGSGSSSFTYNVKANYPSYYASLSSGSFVFVVTGVQAFGDNENSKENIATCYPTCSYNASSGILTVSGLQTHVGAGDDVEVKVISGYVIMFY